MLPVSVRRHVICERAQRSGHAARMHFPRIASGVLGYPSALSRAPPARVYLIRPLVLCARERADVSRALCAVLFRCEWLMKLSSFFSHRAKTEDRGVSLARSPATTRNGNFCRLHLSPVSLILDLPRSFSFSFCASPVYLVLYTFHASFPVDYSKDIGGSFLLEADALATAARRPPSIALHTNDELQISIRAARARATEGEIERNPRRAKGRHGKLFASRRAQKANLRMRCAIALMPVRPAGPSLDFEQV